MGSMVLVSSLWLPHLLSGVLVVLASTRIHTVLRFHTSDFQNVCGGGVSARMVPQPYIPAAEYLFPRAASTKESLNELSSPGFEERVATYSGVPMTMLPADILELQPKSL